MITSQYTDLTYWFWPAEANFCYVLTTWQNSIVCFLQ